MGREDADRDEHPQRGAVRLEGIPRRLGRGISSASLSIALIENGRPTILIDRWTPDFRGV